MNAPTPDPSTVIAGALLGPAVSPRAAARPSDFATLMEPLAPFSGSPSTSPADRPAMQQWPQDPAPSVEPRSTAIPGPSPTTLGAEQPTEEPSSALDEPVMLDTGAAPDEAAAPTAWTGAEEPLSLAGPASPDISEAPVPSHPDSGDRPYEAELQDTADWLMALDADPLSAPDQGAGAPAPVQEEITAEAGGEGEGGVGAGDSAPAEAQAEALVGTGLSPEPGEPALEEVAARLERIARSLRDRSPGELLTEASDPLQMLIAGYALGLVQAKRAGADRAARDEP